MADANRSSPSSVLTSAPPPIHSVAVLGIFLALFVYYLPTLDSIDEVATVETFTRVLFPHYMTLKTVGFIRLAIALSIWATSFQVAVLGEGWLQQTAYMKGSKLRMVPNTLRGIKTMVRAIVPPYSQCHLPAARRRSSHVCQVFFAHSHHGDSAVSFIEKMPFTSVSWNILGSAFTLSAYIALRVSYSASYKEQQEKLPEMNPWVLRAALLLWEMAAPFTLLVATVVRYAIWPAALRISPDTSNLKHPRNVMMHNMNVLFALSESALLGGLPVLLKHASVGPIVGCLYVAFSWCMTGYWNEKKHGPQFIYFFFDTTLGVRATLALVALLAVLMLFYGTFVVAERILQIVDGGLPAHVLFVAFVCSQTMRFRD